MRWLLGLALLALLAAPAAAAEVPGSEVVQRAVAAVPPARDEVLEPLYTVKDSRLAEEPTDWKVRAEGDTVHLQALAAGRPLKAWTVILRRSPLRECLVTSRSLCRDEVLDPSAVRVERRKQQGPVLAPVDAGGRFKLRRNVPAGEALRLSDLEPLPLIAVGEMVSVEILVEGVKVRFEARAREAGFPGRPLRVRTVAGDERTVWVQPDGSITAAASPNLPATASKRTTP